MFLRDPTLLGSFDVVNSLGVLYHLTDPLLSLRQAFASLKRGGLLLLETAGIASATDDVHEISADKRSKYAASTSLSKGGEVRYKMTKGGNYFNPSAEALKDMLEDVGFTDVQVAYDARDARASHVRLYAIGRRGESALHPGANTTATLYQETGITC